MTTNPKQLPAAWLVILVLVGASLVIGLRVGATRPVQSADWHPWHEGTMTCSGARLFFSLSGEGTGVRQKVRFKVRNTTGAEVKVSLSPQFESAQGRVETANKKSVTIAAGSESGPDELVWTPFSSGSRDRVVRLGSADMNVNPTSGDGTSAPPCAMEVILTPAAATAQVLSGLKAIPATEPAVTPAARALLKTLKKQLRELFLDAANSHPYSSAVDAKAVRGAVLAELRAEGIEIEPSGAPPDGFGAVTAFEVERPGGRKNLLAAVVTLRVARRDDNALYVAEAKAGGWSPLLVQEAVDYQDLADAQGAFKYAASPPADGGGVFFVVADHGSTERPDLHYVRFRVLRPAADPAAPAVIEARQVPICGGGRPTFNFAESSDGVTLEFAVADDLFVAPRVVGPHVKYALVGGSVVRVVSLEQSVEKFLDSWVTLPVTDAGRWIRSPAADVVACRHERYKAGNIVPSLNAPEVRQCPALPCEYQTHLNLGDPDFPSYITVIQRGDGFYVEHINNVRPKSCKLP